MPDLHSLSAYDFHLPEELIAQKPVEPRDASRLLVIHRKTGTWAHRTFRDLPEYLDASDLLVANNTQVIPARLAGHRRLEVKGADGVLREEVGGKVEMLLLEEIEPLVWEGAFHAAARLKEGLKFSMPTPGGVPLLGEIVRGSYLAPGGLIWARFDRDPVESGAGELPLPHYINRKVESGDLATYQTVYAKNRGSAAAPTAGLHFTPAVMSALSARGTDWKEVTLHVGLGTFRPVKTESILDHVMHEERYAISESVAHDVTAAKHSGKRIVAVGTTSVRTLESAWDSTAGGGNFKAGALKSGTGRTSIFIYPDGRPFQVVDRLITNFHLPKSTLLMLVSAFGGRDLILAAYAEAVKEKYRFFSYGDAMLVL